MNIHKDVVQVPAFMIPGFRNSAAERAGTQGNLLFKTWGGLGDQLCAEPTLRYVTERFQCDISLSSENPELFRHLKFKEVFDAKKVRPVEANYYVFETICNPEHLTWQFFSHLLTHCVDFPSLCAIRMQLPIAYREVKCVPEDPKTDLSEALGMKKVMIHAGKHWDSKTFPKDWWDAVLKHIREMGCTPVLIGADADDNRGTVDVNTDGCIDLRNKTSVNDTIWLLQRANVLLTNDSSPLHFAATGKAHIGFVATCKHPDYITHFRQGEFGWRMQNLGKGGMWELSDYCPNKKETIVVDKIDEPTLRSWLPEPKVFAEYGVTHS